MEGKVVIEGGPGPYEEDFKAARAEFIKALSKAKVAVTQGDIEEFFFVKGRESGKVLVKVDGGVPEVSSNVGVKIAIIDYDDEERFYKHTSDSVSIEDDGCEDDDCYCEPLTAEQRLDRVPEEFKALILVSGEQY